MDIVIIILNASVAILIYIGMAQNKMSIQTAKKRLKWLAIFLLLFTLLLSFVFSLSQGSIHLFLEKLLEIIKQPYYSSFTLFILSAHVIYIMTT